MLDLLKRILIDRWNNIRLKHFIIYWMRESIQYEPFALKSCNILFCSANVLLRFFCIAKIARVRAHSIDFHNGCKTTRYILCPVKRKTIELFVLWWNTRICWKELEFKKKKNKFLCMVAWTKDECGGATFEQCVQNSDNMAIYKWNLILWPFSWSL